MYIMKHANAFIPWYNMAGICNHPERALKVEWAMRTEAAILLLLVSQDWMRLLTYKHRMHRGVHASSSV
jgi:hypothetical protein